MAGQSRTLKLSILADIDQLKKNLTTGSNEVEGFGSKLGDFSKKAGLAFAAAAAAAAAYASKLAVDGVKAAIEDEKAQTQLALALENATGATNAQIKATEQSILKMSLQTGVADDELRPALGRLVRSTGDITKAQDLLSTALDISAATGKPLETISNALGRAYESNTTALGKLGIGLSAAELKTMSFEQVSGRLTTLFGGAAAANADTYAGKIARVQVAFDEAKETVGAALLPILDKLLVFINQNALPAINAFSNAFSLTSGEGFGKVISDVARIIKDVATPIFEAMRSQFDKIKQVIIDNKDNLQSFFEVVKYVAPLIGSTLGAAVTVIGNIANTVLTIIGKVLGAIKPLLNTAIDGINLIIKGYNAIQFGKDVASIPKIGATGGSTGSISPGSIGAGSLPGGFVAAPPAATGGTTGGTTAGTAVVIPVIPTVTGGTTSAVTGGTSGAATAVVAAVVSTAATAVKKVTETIAASITDQVSGLGDVAGFRFFEETGGQIALAIPSNFNVAGFRRGEEADRATTINVTVNGAIDSEGTARTIVDTLNNQFYRGTGGATALIGI